MKDSLKAIRTFLRRIQFTVTLKTPFIDFSFALLLIQLLLIGSFSIIGNKELTSRKLAREFSYIVIPAMYRTLTPCPGFVRSALTKLIVRMGVIFLTIWPPTEPASRLVRSPL